MSESTDQKAGRYLAEGRVAALLVNAEAGMGTFSVLGSGDEPYNVAYHGEWACDCPARVLECAHIVACRRIAKFEPRRSLTPASEKSDITRQLAEILK